MDCPNGKIYTIKCHSDPSLIYVGSTCITLEERLKQHKKDYKKWMQNVEKYSYITSFELLKYDDYFIELLEEYPCEKLDELRQREGEFIRELKCVNKCIHGRTKQEYLETAKQYRDSHRDKMREYNAEYRKQNKDELKQKDKIL